MTATARKMKLIDSIMQAAPVGDHQAAIGKESQSGDLRREIIVRAEIDDLESGMDRFRHLRRSGLSGCEYGGKNGGEGLGAEP